jgi:hypothetical protein
LPAAVFRGIGVLAAVTVRVKTTTGRPDPENPEWQIVLMSIML